MTKQGSKFRGRPDLHQPVDISAHRRPVHHRAGGHTLPVELDTGMAERAAADSEFVESGICLACLAQEAEAGDVYCRSCNEKAALQEFFPRL